MNKLGQGSLGHRAQGIGFGFFMAPKAQPTIQVPVSICNAYMYIWECVLGVI